MNMDATVSATLNVVGFLLKWKKEKNSPRQKAWILHAEPFSVYAGKCMQHND